MRIAILGGEARDLVNFRGHLISEIVKAGHSVYAMAPGGTADIQADLERLGAAYLSVPLNRTGRNPLEDLWTFLRLFRLFKRLEVECLLAYEAKASTLGVLAASLAGVPKRFVMITGRGSTLQGRARGPIELAVRAIVKAMYRMALRRAHGALFQNQDDLDFFSGNRMMMEGAPHTIIHGSGVDLSHFAPAPLPSGPTTFLFVGRLLRDKGVPEYVEACRALARRRVEAHFRMLGPLDSNPRGIKARQVEAWSREGIVSYLGEAKDVRPALRDAHVLVLPSYGEGTPRSVLEAMSMGRAIITTDAPGCRETVVHERSGLLVPVGDVPALAAAMAQLAADRALISRYAAQSRSIAETKYDVRQVTAAILSFMAIRQ